MKAICINNKDCEHLLSENEVYDVLQCPLHKDGYGVIGVTNQENRVCFDHVRFIPLSEIDELEIIKEQNLTPIQQ